MTSAPLVSILENERPAGGEAIYVENGEIKLRVGRWSAPDGIPPRGTIILAHGRTEFIEKYYEVIGNLRARGFGVLTFDWRGQGLSTRELSEWQLGHINHFEDYFADLDCVLASPFTQEMPGPRFVLAHSMGGNIMLRYLHDHPETAKRAVFGAPMLDLGSKRFQPIARLIIAGMVRLGRGESEPSVGNPANPAESDFMGNPVTSDKARYERTRATVQANLQLGVGGLSWQWLKAATESVNALWQPEFIAGVKTPILFVAAGDERLVEPTGAARYAAASPVCEMVTLPGAMHEIMMERNIFRDQFFDLFDEFIAKD